MTLPTKLPLLFKKPITDKFIEYLNWPDKLTSSIQDTFIEYPKIKWKNITHFNKKENNPRRYHICKVAHSAINYRITGVRWVPYSYFGARHSKRAARKLAIKKSSGQNQYLIWDSKNDRWASSARDFRKFLDNCNWIKKQYLKELPYYYKDN